MRRVADGRELDGEDILMDGQTANKKPPKDQTQVEIPMDGFDLPGGCGLPGYDTFIFYSRLFVHVFDWYLCLLIRSPIWFCVYMFIHFFGLFTH